MSATTALAAVCTSGEGVLASGFCGVCPSGHCVLTSGFCGVCTGVQTDQDDILRLSCEENEAKISLAFVPRGKSSKTAFAPVLRGNSSKTALAPPAPPEKCR